MEKTFEIIDHTADIGIAAYGNDIKQVFENAAIGLFSLITNTDKIKGEIQRKIELSASDTEILLVEWLNELLYIFEVDHIIFKTFVITKIENNKLESICSGEKLNRTHALKRDVKAATYHMLNLSKYNNGYKAQVIFDI